MPLYSQNIREYKFEKTDYQREIRNLPQSDIKPVFTFRVGSGSIMAGNEGTLTG